MNTLEKLPIVEYKLTSRSRRDVRRGHSWRWPWTGWPWSCSPWAPPIIYILKKISLPLSTYLATNCQKNTIKVSPKKHP
jgi:hypothetical protein